MKRVLSIVLALLMVVSTLVVVPMTASAESTADGWDGKTITTPDGRGTEKDPYIIDEPGDLAWFQSVYSNAQVVNTLGYDGKIYAAQYEGFDMADFNNSTFESKVDGWDTKSIDYTKPMVLLKDKKYEMTDANKDGTPDDVLEWGTKIYVKQVCDIDLNGKTLRPMCYYWRYSDGSAHVKGNFFCGEYDGQGYTIKNGTVKQGSTNAAWTAGLFGVLWGATVKNIVFENFHSVGDAKTPGIGIIASRTLGVPDLVERNDATTTDKNEMDNTPDVAAKVGKSVVENIKVLGDCTVESKQGHDAYNYSSSDWRYAGTGGIVGAVSNADIKSCVFLGTIYPTKYDHFVGGVAGLLGFNATVDGCYFGGKISYEKLTDAAITNETHIGGIVGSWRGNNGGVADAQAKDENGTVTNDAAWPQNGAIKGTNINNSTTARGDSAITNCINNGTMNLKATVNGTATTISGKTVCNGGVLGASAQLFMGSSGSYTFSGNVNLAGSSAIPSMTRTGGIAGCFYLDAITDAADAGVNGNTSTVNKNFQKVIIFDCHSVTTTVKSPGSNYPSSENNLVGGIRNAACVEDECTTGLSKSMDMLSRGTIVNAFYKVNNGYFQGEGTKDNPWKISSVADWDFFDLQIESNPAEFKQNDAFEDKYLVQTADLDFGGASRSPLASYQPLDRGWTGHKDGKHVVDIDNTKGSSFRGTYDGQGYAIKNLKLNGTARTNDNWTASGLFGTLYGATVKNIVLDNVDMTAPNGYSGLIAGMTRDWLYEAGADYKGVESGTSCTCENSLPIVNYNYNATKVSRNLSPDFNVIDGIIVKDTCDITITGTAANVAVGSIVGQAVAATVKNCYTAAQISYDAAQTEKHRGVGGVVGTMGVATSVINCIGDADIEYEITGVANKEYPFGGIVGAYDDGGVVESLANTTAGKLISGCVNMGSFHVSKAGTSMGCTVYYGGIVGGANYVDDTIGGRKIENCYNLSNDITITNTADAANPVAMTGMGNLWRIGGLVGCYWCANGTDKADSIEMVNVSTIDLSSINTNTYWNTYDGVICAYNRNVIDSGVTKKCFTITNDTTAPAMSVTSTTDAKFAAAVDKNFVAFAEGRDALNVIGTQKKSGENNTIDVRVLYEMEALNLEEFGEIRYNVTMNGITKSVSEKVVYTAFTSYANGATEPIKPSKGMTYMSAFTLTDIPTTGNYDFTVEAILVKIDENGNESGITRALEVNVNINNGVVTAK